MKIRRSRKTTVIAVFLVLAVAGAAYAYWTAGGAGTGSAPTGTTLALTAIQTTVLSPMYPGDTAQTISGTFTNPNTGPTYVTSVTAAITGVTPVGAGVCTADDYTLAGAVMTVGAEVAVGTGGSWTGATIKFNNTGANQDGCKGATVALGYTIA